jgi:RNA polymerase sigma-70 factor (ECF subfamily)
MPLTTSAHQILSRARMTVPDGDLPEQFWQLIERYRAELLNQALSILGSIADAEDVVQETFCEAFQHSQKLEQARSLGAWLRAINRSNALNRLRDRKRDLTFGSKNPAETGTATTGGFSGIDLRETIAKLIDELPANLRQIIVLHYWEHLSYEEIGRRLNLPTGTVGWLAYEATMKLKGKMKIYLDAPPPGPKGEEKKEN